MITEDLISKIEYSNHSNTKESLFEHLMRHADVGGLRIYCNMAKDTDGLPNMQKLGRNRLNDLPPEGVCVCVCAHTCDISTALYTVGIRTAYVCTYPCHLCLGRVPLDLSTVPRTSSPSHAVLPIHPNI